MIHSILGEPREYIPNDAQLQQLHYATSESLLCDKNPGSTGVQTLFRALLPFVPLFQPRGASCRYKPHRLFHLQNIPAIVSVQGSARDPHVKGFREGDRPTES